MGILLAQEGHSVWLSHNHGNPGLMWGQSVPSSVKLHFLAENHKGSILALR